MSAVAPNRVQVGERVISITPYQPRRVGTLNDNHAEGASVGLSILRKRVRVLKKTTKARLENCDVGQAILRRATAAASSRTHAITLSAFQNITPSKSDSFRETDSDKMDQQQGTKRKAADGAEGQRSKVSFAYSYTTMH